MRRPLYNGRLECTLRIQSLYHEIILLKKPSKPLRMGNLNPFHQLVDVLTHPFEYKIELKKYALAPRPENR